MFFNEFRKVKRNKKNFGYQKIFVNTENSKLLTLNK